MVFTAPTGSAKIFEFCVDTVLLNDLERERILVQKLPVNRGARCAAHHKELLKLST